jgi:rhodanese-related sulfurtransferase/type II secretory pathway component PulM
VNEALQQGWDRVIAIRDASPPDCACRAVSSPLIAQWETFLDLGSPDLDLPRQWGNLRAVQSAQTAPAALAPLAGDITIDVRTPAEFVANPRLGAINIPLDDLPGALDVSKDRRLVVFCASGLRAARACRILRAAGWRACSGHETTCEIGEPESEAAGPSHQTEPDLRAELPALRGMAAQLDRRAREMLTDPKVNSFAPPIFEPSYFKPEHDPKMGAGLDEASPLAGLFGSLTAPAVSAGQGAARQLAATSGQAARDQIAPTIEALKAQLPGLATAAGQAAAPVVTPIAAQAGEAAGRAAAQGAKDEASAWSPGVTIGAMAAGLATLAGLGWLATRKGK